jgi:hypothetical protein
LSFRRPTRKRSGTSSGSTGAATPLPPKMAPLRPGSGHDAVVASGGPLRVQPLLGEADAAAEWESSGRGHAVFLHTPSYDAACDPGTLFLFGRRGTGKTAVLQMLQYETRAGTQPRYLSSWILDQVEAYRRLSINLRGGPFADFPEAELEHVATLMWRWLLTVAAMCGVVWQGAKKGFPGAEGLVDPLAALAKYLAQERILTSVDGLAVRRDPIEVLAELTLDATSMPVDKHATSEGQAPSAARMLDQLARRLRNVQFEVAEQALRQIIAATHRSPLVLVDSVDEYNLTDNIARAVAVGLMRAALDLYTRRDLGGIAAKATFPSEIYPHLRIWNPEKVSHVSRWIIWNHADLVCLVAKRYAYYLNGTSTVAPPVPALDSSGAAERFLDRFIPVQVCTQAGVEFAALAYVFRHTQKKPRQVIALFNAILSLARERGLASAAALPPEVIVDAIRGHARAIAEGVYQVYELVYPEASRLVLGALGRKPAVFTVSDLDGFMKHVSDIRKRHGLSKDEIRYLFVEAGIIGRVLRKSQVRTGGGAAPATVVQVAFQYQRADSLSLFPDDLVAIHPMFYEQLSTVVPAGLFVYPVATDGEASLLSEIDGAEQG